MNFLPVKGAQGEVSFQHDTLIVSELSQSSTAVGNAGVADLEQTAIYIGSFFNLM